MNILHKLGIKSSSQDNVYKALTTLEGLRGWWARDAQGSGKVGDVLHFRFKLKEAEGAIDMKVVELRPAELVLWQVVGGPEEWIGTTVSWELRQEDDWTIVLFKHSDWKEAGEFMHHCSTKWAVFMLSLKALLETGKGSPNPDDFKLDSWE
ncbi:MAG: SRPBCC domain-containing protein [Betaproteobacteria bacterium]